MTSISWISVTALPALMHLKEHGLKEVCFCGKHNPEFVTLPTINEFRSYCQVHSSA